MPRTRRLRLPATTMVALSALVLLAFAAGQAGCGSPAEPAAGTSGDEGPEDSSRPTAEPNGTVVRVVDGDTIVVDVDGVEEKVRLIGIDTPESVKPGSPVECFGKEAAAHTARMLPEGTPVRLELDVEARDRYDRLLAYVYRAQDGEFINVALARDGYASQATYPPNVAHEPELRAAVRSARERGAGLWSSCPDA